MISIPIHQALQPKQQHLPKAIVGIKVQELGEGLSELKSLVCRAYRLQEQDPLSPLTAR